MSESKAPADLATMIDPLMETFTWKWVATLICTFIVLFLEFVAFLWTIIAVNYLLAALMVIIVFVTIALFIMYSRTPAVLDNNVERLLYVRRIKQGVNTFSKFSPHVKKMVVQNFTGFISIDEETGLCKEKTNKEID